MLTATEAQLQNISAKSDKLEVLMTTRIEDVRRLKRVHDEAEEEVTMLRERLREAEGRFSSAQRELDESTASLKMVADEYNRAQLLKKKYHNHLAELKGGPRVVVKVRDPGEQGAAGGQPQGRHDWGAVCVADPCTINVPSKSKSFVFDGVITPDDSRSAPDLFAAVNGPNIVSDVLAGFNCCLFTFGQRGAGKTEALMGSTEADGRSTPGLIDVFIQNLFGAMEQNDVDCFTAKAQMLELKNDVIHDLFSDPSSRQAGEGSPAQFDIVRDEKGRVHVPGLQQVSVTSAQQLSQLFHWGLQSRERRVHPAAPPGARCHTSFSIALENYSRKGNFRRARLTFVDVAGASTAEDSGWINRSLASLGDVISALSTANQRQRHQQAFDPAGMVGELYQRNKLTMLLSEALGGNCKSTMLCCIMPSHGLMEQLLTSLIYAYHLKCIQNPVTPFDIPADLQKLDQQIRSLDIDMGA